MNGLDISKLPINNAIFWKYRTNKRVVMEWLEVEPRILGVIHEEFRDDPEVVLKAVQKSSEVVRHASSRIRELCQDKDPEVTLLTELKRIECHKLSNELTIKPNLTCKPKLKI